MLGGGFEVGRIFARAGAQFEGKEFDRFDAAFDRAKTKAEKPVRAKLEGEYKRDEFERYMASLAKAKLEADRGVKTRLEADVHKGGFEHFDDLVARAREHKGATVELKAKVDDKGFHEYTAKIREAKAEAGSAGGGGGGGLLGMLGKIPLLATAAVAGLGPLIAGIGALGAGAIQVGAAIAPLGGLLAALPAFAGAAAQGMGVMKLALGGVSEAVSAYNTVQQQAPQQAAQARASSQAIAAALYGQQQAVIGVANAQYSLGNADYAEKKAREALSLAYEKARQDLVDLKNAAIDATQAELHASLSLAEARNNLMVLERTPNAGAFAIANARLAVTDAHRNEQKAVVASTTAHNDYNDARDTGVAKSDVVLSAQKALKDAIHATTQAQQGLAGADHAVAQAAQAVATAQQAQALQTNAYADALKKLSPSQRTFVAYLISIQGAFKGLKEDAAGGFLPGLQTGIQSAMRNFPALESVIRATSSALGGIAVKFGAFVGSPAFGRDLKAFGTQNATVLSRMGEALVNVFHGFTNVAMAAQPMVDWLSKGAVAMSQHFVASTAAGRASGTLAEAFRKTMFVTQEFWHILVNLGGTLKGVFDAAFPFAAHMLTVLDMVTKKMDVWTKSTGGKNALAKFFQEAQPALHELWLGLGDLAKGLGQILSDPRAWQAITSLLQGVRQDVIPTLVALIRTVTDIIGPPLVKGLRDVARLLHDLVPALAPIAHVIALIVTGLDALVKGVDWLTQRLPGVLKLLPALVLGGAVFASWKLLGAAIDAVKVKLLATIGLEAAAGGGGGAAGAAGGLSRTGGGLLGRLAGTAAGGALAGAAGAVAVPAAIIAGTVGASVLAHGDATSTNRMGLPGGGGGFQSFERKLGGGNPKGTGGSSLFGDWSFSDPEEKMRKFGDTATKTFDKLRTQADGNGLKRLADEARRYAGEFPRYADAFNKFARDADAAGKKADGVHLTKALNEISRYKWSTEPDVFKQFDYYAGKMTASGKAAGANSVIEMSREMERSGKLPRGSTDRLIRDIEAKYPQLVAGLKRSGHDSMTALDQEIKDGRVVASAKRQIDDISNTWSDAPKLAKTNAHNAYENWRAEMDFLKKKIHDSTGQQRADAVAAWKRIKNEGKPLAKAVKDDWDHQMSAMTTSVGGMFNGLGSAANQVFKKVRTDTDAALKGLGAPTAKWSVDTWKQIPVVGALVTAGHERGGFLGDAMQFARGGASHIVGGMKAIGERGGDMVHAILGRGEAVLNGGHQNVVNAALARAFGMRGGLRDLFSSHRTPHSAGPPARYAKGGWIRTGATTDPTYTGGKYQQFYNNGMSYAELEATPGFPNYAGGGIRKLFGLPTGGTGLAGGFPLLARKVGGATSYRILKSDIGDGAGNAPHATVDLHPASSNILGIGGGSGDIEIAFAGTDPGAPVTGSAGGAGGAAPFIATPVVKGPKGPLLDIAKKAASKAAAAANALVARSAPAAGAAGIGGAVGPTSGPQGTEVWPYGANGPVVVATWLANALKWARSHGGNTAVTSGWRDPRQVISGSVVAPQGHSEHQGTQYPHGAIDFGGPDSGLAEKISFLNSLKGYPGPKPIMPHFHDDGHTSGTGSERGGFAGGIDRIARFAGGGFVGAPPGRHIHKNAPSAKRKSAPTPAAKGSILNYMHHVWNELTSRGLLPNKKQFPSIEFTQGATLAHVNQVGGNVVSWPEEWIDPLIKPSSVSRDYQRMALVHEFAHVNQGSAVNPYDQNLVEGGAQAFTDWAAPQVYPKGFFASANADSNYAGYVKWVHRNKGDEWIRHGQFADRVPRSDDDTWGAGGFIGGGDGSARDGYPMAFAAGGFAGGPGGGTHIPDFVAPHAKPGSKASDHALNDYMASVNRMISPVVAHDSPFIASETARIGELDHEYGQSARTFTRDDAHLTYIRTDPGTGVASVDEHQIRQRVNHIEALIKIKRQVEAAYRKILQALSGLAQAYQEAIKRLTHARKRARGSTKDGYTQTIQDMTGKLNDARSSYTQMSGSLDDVGQDILDLQGEEGALLPTAQTAATQANASLASTTAGTGPGPDIAAQLAQAQTNIATLTKAVRIDEGALATFRGPGDIVQGGQNAYGAAGYSPVGQGQAYGRGPTGQSAGGAAGGYGQVAGGAPTIVQNIYTLHPGDPATLQAIAHASNQGNGILPFVPSSRQPSGV